MVEAVGDNVLIEKEKKEEVTKGGLILTEKKEREVTTGVISFAVNFKPGTKVLYDRTARAGCDIGDKQYWVCKEEDIVAILE